MVPEGFWQASMLMLPFVMLYCCPHALMGMTTIIIATNISIRMYFMFKAPNAFFN